MGCTDVGAALTFPLDKRAAMIYAARYVQRLLVLLFCKFEYRNESEEEIHHA